MKEVILIPSYEPNNKLLELINKIDKKRFDIVVVNDGSGKKYDDLFNKINDQVHLISYFKNQGKGYALKKGVSYIQKTYLNDYIIVTMDSDGQHQVEDAMKLCEYTKSHLKQYVLGMRKRNENTPLKSRLGNIITKSVYAFVTGVSVYDTQTGLRCFSDYLTDFMLNCCGVGVSDGVSAFK